MMTTRRRDPPVPVIPEKDPRDRETVSTGIQIPVWVRTRLEELAEAEGYSRNEIIVFLLKWGLEQYEAERKAKK